MNNNRKKKTYCQIVSCENNKGTHDQMFRAPIFDPELLQKWIQAIQEHQNFDHSKVNYNVCIKHFQTDDIEIRGSKKILRKEAVPTIFEKIVEEICSDANNSTTISVDESMVTLEKKMFCLKIDHDIEIQKLSEKIKSLQEYRKQDKETIAELQKNFAQEKCRTGKLEETITQLKRENYVSANESDFINKYEAEDIIDCLCRGIKARESYSPSVRTFCMSMFNCSPRAYRYLRQKFGNHLPHPQTIRHWYRNSDLDAKSGIGLHSLAALKKKSEEMNENGEQLAVSIVFDEIAIQRSMMWCRSSNRFIGLIDRGTPKEKEEFNLATNVIVFMVCGINANFQQPIAYYFIQTLNAEERANLLKEIIVEVSKLGVKVKSITFDGYSSNVTMCGLLGADIKNSNAEYITYFENPFDKSRVYIIFDPSHMIKLVRNTLGNRLVLWNGSNNKIEWKYYEELVNYSKSNQFSLAHKLNRRHLLWKDRKMHVRTAVETLSSSCANALNFLMKNGVNEFEGAEGIIEFTNVFDKLWDIKNTQNIENNNATIFKSAINPTNCDEIFNFLMDAKSYIISLSVQNPRSGKRQKLINSDVATGFRGFVVDIISYSEMYRDLVEEHHWMLCLASYRLSQDHLEMMFGKIRMLNGHNDNPNAQQFSSAYRKLLFEADLVLSSYSNVEARSTSNILTVSSSIRKPKENLQTEFENLINDDVPQALIFEIEHTILSENLSDDARDPGIAHVANELEYRLKTCNQIYCQMCLQVLNEDEKISDAMCVNLNNGKPCKSTFNLCKLTDSAMKILINTKPDFKEDVYNSVLNIIDWSEIFPEFHEDEEHGEDHKNFLVKYFIDEYINIICANIAKQTTIATQKKYLRNRLKKLIHNNHQ